MTSISRQDADANEIRKELQAHLRHASYFVYGAALGFELVIRLLF